MTITAEQLAELASIDACTAELWAPVLSVTLRSFDLETPERTAAFIAQTAYESMGFSHLEEVLNYSAHRLCEVWPNHFFMPPAESEGRLLATDFAAQPERLGNTIYANRLGNRAAESGDGWKYRGRGLLQITGKLNFARMGRALGLDLLGSPFLLTVPIHATNSAAVFWNSNGCNALADENSTASFRRITQCINGGLTGEDGREEMWMRARNILGCE